MIDLESSDWLDLPNAYEDLLYIPTFLNRLAAMDPTVSVMDWGDFMGSLLWNEHLFPTAFAVLPHVVAFAARRKPEDRLMYMLTVGLIELHRRRRQTTVPEVFSDDYFSALKVVPSLLLECAACDWNAEQLQILFVSMAAMRGKLRLAAALMEGLSMDEFQDWPEES
ncbi:MAG: hypothetical protein K1Y36_26105 [Blastocatellia bacterium]|nr:hypothetical protein [Blastocatellia bacterium]